MAGPRPGEVLNDRYELVDRIGGGSMGEVWRSRDRVLGRTVAVKIVLPALLDTPTFRARFVAEARVMAMMDHPGIVRVYDYGYTDAADPDTPGAAFLVMEFIEGESLDRLLGRTGALEPRFAMRVLASLLDALGAVHRTGVVHRDVKPANVMLTAGGVVLADFGIARSAESLGLTAADALMGTVPYLAPELFHAQTPTPAADVYAVGILGYELLSGRQPFRADSTAAVMYMHMHEPPPPLPDYVTAHAAGVLWQALEKDPALRWADGAEMAEAVRRVLTGPVEDGEDLAVEPGPDGLRRGYAGIPSGYEHTLTDSGGRRRRRLAAEGGAHATARGAAAAAGYAEQSYGGSGVDGWYGRDPGFAQSVASRFGGRTRHGGGEYEGEYPGSYGHVSDLEETAQLSAMPEVGAHRPYPADRSDGTRVYDELSTPMADSLGRRGRSGDSLDATGVYGERITPMADSGGLRTAAGDLAGRADLANLADLAGPPADGTRLHDGFPTPITDFGAQHSVLTHDIAEPPAGRRAAESHQSTTAFGGRGRGSRSEARRKALITTAVAVPAVLGLSVALTMSSSRKSPDGGNPAPGTAQRTDVPIVGTATNDTVPPTEPMPTTISLAGHSGYAHHAYATYPTSTRSSGSGSPSSAAAPTSATSATSTTSATSSSVQPTETGSTASSSQSDSPSTTGSSEGVAVTTAPSSPSSKPFSTST